MNEHRRIRSQLYEFITGELSPEDRSAVELHLRSCNSCRNACEELKEIVENVPRRTLDAGRDRPADYWAGLARRVEDRLRATDRSPSRRAGRLQGWLEELFQPRIRPVYVLAGSLAAILVAVILWLYVPRGDRIQRGEAGAPSVVAARSTEAVNDYFEQARTLLIGITNMPPASGTTVDFSVEKTAARSLIRQARLLETESVDARSRELIQELGRVLVELANLEETADVPEVEMIRTGVRQQNLLFKIRMAEHRVKQQSREGS